MAHKPLDYSKWDNIDTGSDEEDEPVPSSVSQRVQQCSAPECPAPAPAPAPGGGILAQKIPCKGDKGVFFFTDHMIDEKHPIFSSRGTLSPVSQLIGIPILIWRFDSRPSLSIPRSADFDNQFTTWLMIEPKSGFAPPQWQQGIGTALAARADKKPLYTTHLEGIWMFIDRLLDRFGSGDPPRPGTDMTPAAFKQFWEDYREGQMSMEEVLSDSEEEFAAELRAQAEARRAPWLKEPPNPYEV